MMLYHIIVLDSYRCTRAAARVLSLGVPATMIRSLVLLW